MEKITYIKAVEEILKFAKEPLTGKQIWDEICKKGLDRKLSSIGKTPIATLEARVYVDMKNAQNNSLFMIASKRPTTFWLKARENELSKLKFSSQDESREEKQEKSKFCERDLHPLLVKFVYESQDFNLNCKTIYHEKSKKAENGKNKWNYPDIVGVYFPYQEYEKQTLELLKNLNQNSYKLYSFELKIALTWANLKESYFQAMSNSSWANEGYLVVFEEIDDEILAELRRLNQSFGIGVIKLEARTHESKILLSAKESGLDISTLDKLVEDNKDFAEFVDDINKQIRVDPEVKIVTNFDKVFKDDEMAKYLKDRSILEEK